MICPIYVINLERAARRLHFVSRQLDLMDIPFTRVPAIDRDSIGGKDAALYDPDQAHRYYFVPINDSEIACFLSHRQSWANFLEFSDAPFCVVLEDDVELSHDFADVIEALTEPPVDGWDIVKLYNRHRRLGWADGRLSTGHRLMNYLVAPLGTVGTAISRAGAQRLLDGTKTIRRPVDVQIQYWWEMNLRVRTVDPPVVRHIAKGLEPSQVTAHRPATEAHRTKRNLRRAVYRGGLAAQSVIRHLIQAS